MTENVKASPYMGPKALEIKCFSYGKAKTKYNNSVTKNWIPNSLKGCLSSEIKGHGQGSRQKHFYFQLLRSAISLDYFQHSISQGEFHL
jgi:hypothetical protein